MDNNNVENLLTELGLESLPQDQKDELIVRMAETLQSKISTRIINSLSDAKKRDFDAIVEGNNDKEIEQFLRDNVPGFEFLVRDEYENFRAEMIDRYQSIKEIEKNL
jgi:hypothetical protein